MNTGAQNAEANGKAAGGHSRTGGAPTSREYAPRIRNSAFVDSICQGCGCTFPVRRWQITSGRGGWYCSRKCRGNRPAKRHNAPRPDLSKPTVQLGTLEPGTKFRIRATTGEVVRQHRTMRETVVRFEGYGQNGRIVRSTWPASVNVRLVA